jgi:hypothetical protein
MEDDFMALLVNAVRTTEPMTLSGAKSLRRKVVNKAKRRADVIVATWLDDGSPDGVDWLIIFGGDRIEELGAISKDIRLRTRSVHVTSLEVADYLSELFFEPPPAKLVCTKEGEEPVLYVETGGKRIAKRYSGQRWISLEPGYTVRGSEPGGDRNSLTIEYQPDHARAQ